MDLLHTYGIKVTVDLEASHVCPHLEQCPDMCHDVKCTLLLELDGFTYENEADAEVAIAEPDPRLEACVTAAVVDEGYSPDAILEQIFEVTATPHDGTYPLHVIGAELAEPIRTVVFHDQRSRQAYIDHFKEAEGWRLYSDDLKHAEGFRRTFLKCEAA